MTEHQKKLTRNDGVFMAHRVAEMTSTGLGSASMVLPFLFTAFSGPPFLAGLLLPVFRIAVVASGAVIAPVVLMSRNRRFHMAGGMALTALALLSIAAVTGPQSAVWTLVLVFFGAALFMGVGAGVHSIAENSIMAQLWEVERRGSLMGTTGALAGVFLVAVALASALLNKGSSPAVANLNLVWWAAAVAALSAVFSLMVREGERRVPRHTEHGRKENLWHRAKESYLAVGGQSWYRRMIAARFLLVSVEYGTAFYAVHAAERHASAAGALAIFAVATALGVVVGGLVSRRVLRTSERRGLAIGGAFGCLAATGALIGEVDPMFRAVWVYTLTFFLLSIGGTCVYNARTAYLLACVAPEDRENGVALTKIVMEPANTLFVVAMGALAQYKQPAAPIAVIFLLGLGGVLLSLRLPPSRRSEPVPLGS